MKWKKAPDELKALLEEGMKNVECEKRPMFGYPAYFINKNMFSGLFQDQVFIRLPENLLSALQETFPAIVHLEPMPGRPMKDYFVIPKELYTDVRAFRTVIKKAAEYARGLAPKPKAKKSRKE